MSWYSETNALDVKAEDRSLAVAFANLLQKFDIEQGPGALYAMLTQDDPAIDWWSVAEYIDGLDMGEVTAENASSWPTSSNAIIKFRRLDTAAAGPVDHYCAVADHRAHSIIDSLDGRIKAAGVYGQPMAWATYVDVADEPLDDPIIEEEAKPGTTYKVLSGGESVWQIARKLKVDGLSGKDIADHNELDPTQNVPGGTVLHLPVAIPQTKEEDDKIVDFEFLDTPLEMHIIKPGGTTKYAFGNAKKWKDIKPSGRNYPENINVKISAVATVPLADEPGDVTATYYLEDADVDVKRESVRWTTGFNHSHLGEGFVERPQPAPTPQVQEQIKETIQAAEEAQKQPEPEPEEPAEVVEVSDSWKDTLRPLYDDRHITSFLFNDDTLVPDLEGTREPKLIKAGRAINIRNTVEKDGVKYGLPVQVNEINGLWFAVPMDRIKPEDEYFNYGQTREERLAAGQLTSLERYWYQPLARSTSQYTRLKHYLGGKNKNKGAK